MLLPLGLSLPAQADEADDWFNRTFGAENSEDTNITANSSIPEIYDPEGYRYENKINPDAPSHKAGTTIVAGNAPKARALQPFSWSEQSVKRYADICNLYASTFPNVKIYCMPVPLASAFYTPNAAAPSWPRSQYSGIRKMFSMLSPEVEGVNLVPILGQHAAEDIYSRTDHHWAPLGAYYAAQQLAAHAGVPFMDISNYTRHEIPDYMGTMYKYSNNDQAIKNSPETFVYFTPNNTDYNTTYTTYRTAGLKITGEQESAPGKFFQAFKGAASYCTFMGGDTKITKVRTSVNNGRRVLILKDSFGNAIPGYLFGSFEEIHVVDCRYFNKNMKKYVADNGITDIVFANNLGHAVSERICSAYRNFLNQ